MYKSFEMLSTEFISLTNFDPSNTTSNSQARLLAKFQLEGSVDSFRAAILAREIFIAISLEGVNNSNKTSLQNMLEVLSEISGALLLQREYNITAKIKAKIARIYAELEVEKYLPTDLILLLQGREIGLRVGFFAGNKMVWSEIISYISQDSDYKNTLESLKSLESRNLVILAEKEKWGDVDVILFSEVLFLLRVLYENVTYYKGVISQDKLIYNFFLLNGYHLSKKHFWNDLSFTLDLALKRKSKSNNTSRALSIMLFLLIILTQLTDYASTKAGVDTGISESNALMHYFMDSQGMVKFLILKFVAGIFLGWYFWGRVMASLVVVFIFTLVTFSNLLVIMHTLEIILL
jgi:hypothetical protein